MTEWKGKWNYKPIFIGEIDEATRKEFAVAQIEELFQIRGKEKNARFFELFQAILETLGLFMKDLGFLANEISYDQIFLLDKDEYDEKVDMDENSAGKCHTGCVYVVDYGDFIKLAHDLTHEISHLNSFYSITAKQESASVRSFYPCMGYGVNKLSDSHGWYSGLDEGTTEFFAFELRRMLVQETDFFSKDESEDLCSKFVYYKHVSLLKSLLSIYSKEGLTIDLLFKSYIDGSADFINKLKNLFPDTYRYYKSLDAQKPEEVERVALALGGQRLLNAFKEEVNCFIKF